MESATKARVPIAIGVFAIAYPLVSIGYAQLHYRLTSKNLSPLLGASILLGALSVCLLSAFALLLSRNADGKQRMIAIACSLVGGLLNFLFFCVVGASY